MNYRPYQEPKRLYRSNDSVICGVCGGIAEHFDMPPWGVRLLFIMSMFFFPPLLLIYIVLALALKRRPVEPPPIMSPNDPFQGMARGASHSEMLARVQERFDALDKRLQRMEDIVTHPGFTLEQKYRDLQ